MAVDYAIEILIDNSISGTTDKYAEIVRRVIQALESDTLAITYAASYTAGTTSRNGITLTVGGTGTVGFGIRVTIDRAAFGEDDSVALVRRIIQALESETLTIVTGGDGDGTKAANPGNEYTAGDRAYQVLIAVS